MVPFSFLECWLPLVLHSIEFLFFWRGEERRFFFSTFFFFFDCARTCTYCIDITVYLIARQRFFFSFEFLGCILPPLDYKHLYLYICIYLEVYIFRERESAIYSFFFSKYLDTRLYTPQYLLFSLSLPPFPFQQLQSKRHSTPRERRSSRIDSLIVIVSSSKQRKVYLQGRGDPPEPSAPYAGFSLPLSSAISGAVNANTAFLGSLFFC